MSKKFTNEFAATGSLTNYSPAPVSLNGLPPRWLLLSIGRLPARLNAAEASYILGFTDADIPVLIAAKLLTPLGKPAVNAPKFFCAKEVVTLSEKREWLDKATLAIATFHKRKNVRGGGWEARKHHLTPAT